MKLLALPVAILIFPSLSWAQTLCRTGEIDYFSCQTTANQKIVSVCGNILDGEINSESWLQYRFGNDGAIELSYPQKASRSVEKFEGNYFDRYNVVDLRFINGRTLYSVEFNYAYNGDEAQRRDQPSGGITVHIGKSKRVSIPCKRVNALKYFRLFSDLNASIRTHNGETDILHHYFNHVSN